MSNIKRVEVTGFAPFDIATRDKGCKVLGVLNGPSFGIHIHWGRGFMCPLKNEYGGQTTYYEFSIEGEEAVNAHGWVALLNDFIEGGAIVFQADIQDIEDGGRAYSQLGALKQNIPQWAFDLIRGE